MTALFEDIIFGPIQSRRLGVSLGVNLLPQYAKICNFDCIYCECGSNRERRGEAAQRRFAKAEDVEFHLRGVLSDMKREGRTLDVITFAGNGEPTLHPHFESIIDMAIDLRDKLAPQTKISVLSNATTLDRDGVIRALHRVDNNILKLDSAIGAMAHKINRPTGHYSTEGVVDQMSRHFGGECVVQSMFLRGVLAGEPFDNSGEEYLTAWLAALRRISPRQVMIYSLDRDTPCEGLERLSHEELERIAQRVTAELSIDCRFA
ncbi:MAG: radical SAM protein [Rikenellaceae bacterium]